MNRLYSLRKQRGLTQRQLGDELNISQQSVSRIEKIGERNIPSDLLVKLAEYYDLSIDYLIGKEEYVSGVTSRNQELFDLCNRLSAYNRQTLTILAKRLLSAQDNSYQGNKRQAADDGDED